MNRWKAAGTHLCLSFLVIGTVVALVFYFWFPHRLYLVAGLDRLFITMLGIDLVAGPLLTLVVYKSGERHLRRDLATIGVIQAAFLAYGLHTTWASRPVLLVGAIDRLTLIYANEITPKDLAKGMTAGTQDLSWTGPRLFGAQLPANAADSQALMFAVIAGGADIDRQPKYYVAYPQAAPGLLQHSRVVDRSISDADLRSTGKSRSQLRLLPITSSRADATMLIDAVTAAPLLVLPGTAFAEQAQKTGP
jgi:hypothetical protein